jgi:hypothetical protein
VRLRDGSTKHGKGRIRTLGRQLVTDQGVKPTSRERVLLERLHLEQLDEVLDRGAEVSTDADLLQRDDHVLTALATVCTVREDVAELRVGKLVQTTGCADGEITPDVRVGPEVELLEGARRGLETGIRVLCCDANGDNVALRARLALELVRLGLLHLKVDLGGGSREDAIELSDALDAVERDAHRDKELCRREVDTRHHFCRGVLDLQARVQLKEIECVIGMVVKI